MSDWRDWELYVITGENYHPGRELLAVMEQTLQGGARMVQLRDKWASKEELLQKGHALRALTRKYNVPLIINDYVDIALEVEADGVHLGQEDGGLEEARRLLGPDRIIGISTHKIEQARAAERGGADYIGVGPVYPTGTKPGREAVTPSYVRQVATEIRIPFVAIGGITLSNVDEVLQAGATRVCAVSAIVGSADPADACRQFLSKVQEAAAAKAAVSIGADARASRGIYAAAGASAGTGTRGERLVKRIIVNGLEQATRADSLADLVLELGQQNRRMIAELDGTVVDRSRWHDTTIEHGAVLELVHFVGGG
ncbi:thiamine phosphate synthase [Paenibacillus sp. GCM10023252]|uniref:thiamine phosphate synthase n=1 Tax=Paenibacillus sp. GCM10023252 TaxID=3252649 RepID=UPI0036219C64